MSRVFETYEEAQESIEDPDGFMVCGVRMEDESAKYFVLPRDVDDEEGYQVAFRVRHGREMSSYERWLRDLAMDRRTVDA